MWYENLIIFQNLIIGSLIVAENVILQLPNQINEALATPRRLALAKNYLEGTHKLKDFFSSKLDNN